MTEPTAIETAKLPSTASLCPHLPEVLHQHLKWLAAESVRYNLTRVPQKQWIERHVMDSLVPVFAGWSLGDRFLDLGTGAGFPGIPLAAFYPDTSFTLVEKRRKVAEILRSFLAESCLSARGKAVAERAEILARDPEERNRYDRVVTRAVASLACLIELGIPFLKTGGELWCWKSDLSEIETSRNALAELRAEATKTVRYRLPGEKSDRFVIAIEKKGETPDRYPRRAGIPQKRPL